MPRAWVEEEGSYSHTYTQVPNPQHNATLPYPTQHNTLQPSSPPRPCPRPLPPARPRTLLVCLDELGARLAMLWHALPTLPHACPDPRPFSPPPPPGLAQVTG